MLGDYEQGVNDSIDGVALDYAKSEQYRWGWTLHHQASSQSRISMDYDAGWESHRHGLPFDPSKTQSWQEGWNDQSNVA